MSKTNSLGLTLLVTTVLALGIAAAWQYAVQWLSSLVEDHQPGTMEQLALDWEGQPLIKRYSRLGRYSGFQAEEVLTLNGDVLPARPDAVFDAQYIEGGDRYIPDPPFSWWQRMAGFNDGGTPAIYWYLVHDGRMPGRVYGIGFHSKTKSVVGYFARNGFSQSPPPRDEWFHVSGELRSLTTAHLNLSEPAYNASEPVFLLADGKLWKIDVARRQLKAVVDCPSSYALGRSWQIPDKSQLAEKPTASPDEVDTGGRPKLPENADRIAVRQPASLIIYDRRTGKQASFPLPAKVEKYGLSTWLLPEGNLVVLRAADYEKKLPPELMWLDPAGKVVKEQTVRMARYEPNLLPIPEVWRENIRVPMPLNKALLFALWTHIEAQRATPPSYAVGFGKVFKRAWLAALVLFVVCAIPAYAAYRRQKRFGLPHAGVWAAFTYVFGIPGWVAYRFHRRWPVLDDCPNCRQLSPRDREACLDCGALFPPPPAKGIEVFA